MPCGNVLTVKVVCDGNEPGASPAYCSDKYYYAVRRKHFQVAVIWQLYERRNYCLYTQPFNTHYQ